MRSYDNTVTTDEFQQKLLELIKKHGYAHADDSWYSKDSEIKEYFPRIFDFFEYLLDLGYERVYIENRPNETYTLNKPVFLAGEEVYIEETYGQGSDVSICLKKDSDKNILGGTVMSSYINFYIKNGKQPGYRELFSFGGSSYLYQAFYELYPSVYDREAEPLTGEKILAIQKQLEIEKKGLQKMRERSEEQIKEISNFNNTANEKLVAISDVQTDIEEIDDEMLSIEKANNILEVLLTILDNAFNESEPILYAGMECWAPEEEPTYD